MKKSFIFSLFLVSGVFFLNPSISKEIVEDKNLIEKVSFDIWWEDKYNKSFITLRTYPEDIKTIQVGNGRFINKNQILENHIAQTGFLVLGPTETTVRKCIL